MYLISLLFFCYPSGGQINRAERTRLIEAVKNPTPDSMKIANLILLSENYNDSAAPAFYYDSIALRLSQDIRFPYGIFIAVHQKGIICEENLKDYVTATRYY